MINISAIDEFKKGGRPRTAAFLEEEIRRLKAIIRPPLQFPPEWGLTPRQAAVLAAIYAGDDRPVSMARIIYAIYGDDEPSYAENCVKVFICKMKKKLRSHNVRILVVYGLGWHLDRWSREFVRKAIEQK